MQSKNKVFVVTGGGNGIGRELVLNLLNRGAKVAAIDLIEASLSETKNIAGVKAINLSTHILNITDRQKVEQLPEEIIKQHGAIDGLVNCAGIIQPFVRINDLDYSSIDKVLGVNFYGSLYFIKAFLPHLLKRNEAHILNVSSMGGFLPVPGQGIYGASKAAVKLLTEALYAELLDTGVKVSVVFPGAIGTNISANSGVEAPKMPEGNSNIKMLPPFEAAEIIISSMEKNKFHIYVGKDSKFMNLLYRLNPQYATRLISKQMRALLSNK
jgi:short-subunit dehydrogenase